MYLKYVNILYFIILTHLCLRIYALSIGMEQNRIYSYKGNFDSAIERRHSSVIQNRTLPKRPYGASESPRSLRGRIKRSKACVLPLSGINNEMPIIYDPVTKSKIYPNKQGNIILDYNRVIGFSCSGNHFVSPVYDENITEITVNCINKPLLRYNNVNYPSNDFKCKKIPIPLLVLTNKTCQIASGRVMNIGFQIKNELYLLYKICFDMEKQTPLYAWYHAEVPMFRYNQNSTSKPQIISTEWCKSIDFEAAYENQQITLEKILDSKKLAKWYIQYEATKDSEGCRYLVKGYLMSNLEFVYTHEQHATYFYENTAPQWIVYQNGPRKDIEKYFKRFLCKHKAKHVVVSGTFVITAPLNHDLQRCNLYLRLPEKIPVPEFYWKLDYNMKEKDGIVFVGFNGPWRAYDTMKQVCATKPCPNRLKRTYYTRDSFYCCDLESFERSFGKLDSVLFEKF